MFGSRFDLREDRSDEHDVRLGAVLRQWRGIEPHSGFEAMVWRRIRTEGAATHAGAWAGLWEKLLPHPALAAAATALVAVMLGTLAGAVTPGHSRVGHRQAHALLRPDTVAGAYLALSEGRHP